MRNPKPSRPAPAHVVGEAAARTEGTASDTPASSDWLAEALHPAKPAPGVAVSTRPSRGDPRRGRALESKRGQR